MAKYVLKDASIKINGTAVSDHAASCELEDKADEINFTTFSANNYKSFGQGLKDATVTVEFFSDFGANEINSIIQPLYASGGTFTLEVKPTSATVSATNPTATMVSSLYSYSGIAGKVGEASTFTVAFRNAGTAGLVWATA